MLAEKENEEEEEEEEEGEGEEEGEEKGRRRGGEGIEIMGNMLDISKTKKGGKKHVVTPADRNAKQKQAENKNTRVYV